MTAPRICGIDLSLTSTGLADSEHRTERWRTTRDSPTLDAQLRRLWAVVDVVTDFVRMEGGADLVVIEGPSLGQQRQAGQHARSGLWWMTVAALDFRAPVLVVPPATRAMYATGKGNAGKDEVLAAAIKRYPAWNIAGNDIADAVILCAIGARMWGTPMEESLPISHLRALNKFELPST